MKRNMSWDKFVKQFKPQMNESYSASLDGYLFEPAGSSLIKVLQAHNKNPDSVWTCVAKYPSRPYIVPGFSRESRIGHLIVTCPKQVAGLMIDYPHTKAKIVIELPPQIGGDSAISFLSDAYAGPTAVLYEGCSRSYREVVPTVSVAQQLATMLINPQIGGFSDIALYESPSSSITCQNLADWLST